MLDEIIQNPFPGLRAFEEDEDILFFGREKQVDELLKKLRLVRFLTVIGSSGSGKSSLVKSGLIPSLHSGFMAGAGSRWKICSFRPGNNPIGNMAKALSENGVLYAHESPDDEQMYTSINESVLRRSNFGLIDAYKQSGIDPKNNLLVLVDQFEELFRFIRYEKDAKEGKRDSVAFINLLLKVTEQRELPIYVVFTMRSDFLGDCTEFRGLPEAINEGQYLVPRMTREERRDAITGPVAVGGATMSPRLLNQLLNDVGDNPDQLPILQHALMRTWEIWKNKNKDADEPSEIDLDEYTDAGTMQHALSQHAEEAYNELETARARQICESVFKALTDRGADARGIRRPSQLAELCELSNATHDEVVEVIEVFRRKGRGFLMPPAGVPLTEASIIDISHESIMRVWERLMLWVDEENQSAQIYLRVCDAADLYELGRGGLLRDPELQVAWKWKEDNQPNAVWASRYNNRFDKAILFLEHSKEQFEKELLFKEKMQKQRLRRARRVATIISIIAFGAFLLAIYSFELRNLAKKQTKIAEQESSEAKRQRQIAIGQEKLAEKSREQALLSAKQALEQKSIAEVEKQNANNSEKKARMQQFLAEQQTAYAQRQKTIADANANEAKQQQGIAETERQRAVSNENEAVAQRKVSSQLKDLAEARNMAYEAVMLLNDSKLPESRAKVIEAYKLNAANGGPQQNNDIYSALYFNWIKAINGKNQFAFHKNAVRGVAPGPAAGQMVSVDESGMLCIMRVASGIPEAVSSYDLKDDARAIATSPDGSKAIVVTATGKAIALAFGAGGASMNEIGRTAIDGIGKQVFFRSASEVMVLTTKGLGFYNLDNTGLKLSRMLNGPYAVAGSSRSGKIFLASGNKLTVYGGSAEVPSKPGAVYTLPSRITSISSDAAENYLAAGTYDGGIWIRDLRNNVPEASFTPHASSVNDLRFAQLPGGNVQLASASSDHTIRLMDVKALLAARKTEDIVLREHNKWVYTLFYTPDGQYLYSGSEDKRIIGWHSTMAGIYKSLTSEN